MEVISGYMKLNYPKILGWLNKDRRRIFFFNSTDRIIKVKQSDLEHIRLTLTKATGAIYEKEFRESQRLIMEAIFNLLALQK